MVISPLRIESVPYKFDSFGKKVLRNALIDYHKEMSELLEHEISLTDLPENAYPLSTRDKYFAQSRYFDTSIGSVVVEDPEIADVISIPPDQQREVILLYYIAEKTDK